MNILHVIPCFYPATYWGGPVFSTKAICDGVAARPGMSLRVLTTDTGGPHLSERVTPVKFAYPVDYARRISGDAFAPGMFLRLPRALAEADVVHLTGTYNAPTLPVMALCKAMGKPLVWSPRGALQATEDWQETPHRRAKRAFAGLMRQVLPKEAVIHVTSEAEAESAAKVLPRNRLERIANGIAVPRLVEHRPRAEQLRLMFLGRLHPKKGLDHLIVAMEALPATTRLDIYGDGPSDYTFAVKRVAAQTGRDIRFHGAVSGAEKTRAFADADLFVLPSYSENFGIAVAEALAHEVPVLTTDATPWAGIETRGCGRVIRLGHDDLAEAILDLALGDLRAMGQRGRVWMQADFGLETMAARFADLYRDLAWPAGRMVPA